MAIKGNNVHAFLKLPATIIAATVDILFGSAADRTKGAESVN